MSLLVGERVSRSFGSLLAVDAVDLVVEPGEVVGLIGANGAGKTTLIRMCLGLLPATAGRVALFGAPPSRQTRARLGYVPQGLGLWEDLTVAENLSFAARAFGDRGFAARTFGDRVFADRTFGRREVVPDDAEVRASAGTLVADLPLGLRRRVAFAVALAHAPELLVLDEPTSGVDPLARARLWDTIRGAAESGAGALVTTHHMAEADECDRLIVMAGGRVVAQGTSAAIIGGATAVEVATDRWEPALSALAATGLPLALVGRRVRAPGADPVRVRSILEASGIAAELRVVGATLDEAFVAIASRPTG